MSFRKPKSVIIRDDSSEDDEIVKPQLNLAATKRTKPKQKNRIKIKAVDEENSHDDSIDKIDIPLKLKKRKPILSIPLFSKDDAEFGAENEESHKNTMENIQIQLISQREKIKKEKSSALPQIITEQPHQGDAEEFANPAVPEESKDFTLETLPSSDKEPEYISIESPEHIARKDEDGDDEDDENGFGDYDMVDDGRLPLTEKESMIQQKLHNMGIEDALYEIELSGNEEIDDWETEKVRHGGFGNVEVTKNKVKAPKLNLTDGQSLSQEIQNISLTIQDLEKKKTLLVQRLKELKEDSSALKQGFDEISNKINSL